MNFMVRPGRLDDVDSIIPWTADTFDWGDYIPTRLPLWLESADSEVLVCIDEADEPKAVAHVVLLSPTEGWMEGARVHPDFRRSGMGSALNDAGVAWAKEHGARVVRLATEEQNIAARSQVERLGYREVSRWVFTGFDVDRKDRAPEHFRLRPAPGSDAEAAWLFWAASDLAREGRELIANGWQWRTARPDDVTRAASSSRLFQSPAGWVIIDQPDPKWIRCGWMATTPDDILRLLGGLLDLAAELEAEELDIKMPNVPWTAEALTRVGGDPALVLVYAKAV